MVKFPKKSNKTNVPSTIPVVQQTAYGPSVQANGMRARDPGPQPSSVSRFFARFRPPAPPAFEPFPLRPTPQCTNKFHQPEPVHSFNPLPKRYTIAKPFKMMYEPKKEDRDMSVSQQEQERKIDSLLARHRFEARDWGHLQSLLETEGLRNKLSDEHLRWLLHYRDHVYVVRIPLPEAGKLLRRIRRGGDNYVENATHPPTW